MTTKTTKTTKTQTRKATEVKTTKATKATKTAKAAKPQTPAKPRNKVVAETMKVPEAVKTIKVEEVNKVEAPKTKTPKARIGVNPMGYGKDKKLVIVEVKPAKPEAPKAKVEKVEKIAEKPAKPEATKAKVEKAKGYLKLDETTKELRALARRYEFLAKALARDAMLRVNKIGEMVEQMRATLDAFEDDGDKGLGAWVHAVPLLKEGATEEQHRAAVLKSDKGRHYRRLVRGWLADVKEAKYDGDLIAR